MFDEDCVYDTTEKKEYYRDYIEKESRRFLIGGTVAAFITILGGLIPIICLGVEGGRKILPITILATFGGGFVLYISISFFRKERF